MAVSADLQEGDWEGETVKVRELISLLESQRADALVVVPAFDHSYRDRISIGAAKAEASRGELSEFYEEQGVMFGGKVIDVLVIE